MKIIAKKPFFLGLFHNTWIEISSYTFRKKWDNMDFHRKLVSSCTSWCFCWFSRLNCIEDRRGCRRGYWINLDSKVKCLIGKRICVCFFESHCFLFARFIDSENFISSFLSVYFSFSSSTFPVKGEFVFFTSRVTLSPSIFVTLKVIPFVVSEEPTANFLL